MLEPDFYTKWEEPIFLKVEDGSFLCKSLYPDETFIFESVDGRLTNIYAANRRFKSGCYPYWHLELTDNENSNIYVIVFPFTSAMFQNIVLKLATAKSLSNIKIDPYTTNRKRHYQRRTHSKVNVYADEDFLFPLQTRLPKIDCYNYGGQILKNYDKRIGAVKKYHQWHFGANKKIFNT